jgi:phosphopantothenoylcysteine decarboxylase/phosphopantothenate--cysteine ligase
MLLLPATANIIAKAANGLADDLLSTLYLAFSGPAVFCPAMNPLMYSHAATMDNMVALTSRGHTVVDAGFGDTACGEKGQGRLADWEEVREAVIKALTKQSLKGLKVLVTAGPTREAIDPVRYVSNRSSGKMGYAVAQEAMRRGGDVTLVTGPCALPVPRGVKVVNVVSAAHMANAVEKQASQSDVVIMAAAVADYTPAEKSEIKIKKSQDTLVLKMKRTEDILAGLLEKRRPGQIITGFCAETGDLEARAMEKLEKKPVDLLVANDVTEKGAGFDVDTNRVMLVDRDHNVEKLPLLSKEEVAARIMDRVEEFLR